MKVQKDPIVFVHGVCHGAWCWEPHFIPFFEQLGHPCLALNLPGHNQPGVTKGINKYSLADYVRCLEETVESIDQPPIIVGHSMGGLIIQKYLEKSSCKKVVLLAPVPPSGIGSANLRFILKHPGAVLHLIQQNLYGVFHHYAHTLYHSDFDPALLAHYQSQMCSESLKAYLQMMVPRIKINHHLATPMLVLGAANDQLLKPDELKELAHKYGAQVKIINDIGHNMMLDTRQDEVAKIMKAWLEKG